MINKTISHYKILEKLGEGGMGVVYLAEDTKLERRVAIKFLPHHIAANSDERTRFEIEAKAAAALNHSNVATIYAIEHIKDDVFIVMEYIDGRELKEEVKSKKLEAGKVLELALQIAEGLQAAHKKGIVHRDIKSANIMVTEEGKIKIMDFGLAKIGKGIQLTKEQSTLGTAAYMSPEQARGDEVDQRSDIWSYGVVFYEMITGQLPFKGDYEQAVVYSILNEEPEAIAGIRSSLPLELERIINKMLSKNINERYTSVEDILVDLRKVAKEIESGVNTSTPKLIKKSLNKKYFLGSAVILILCTVLILFLNPQSKNYQVGRSYTSMELPSNKGPMTLWPSSSYIF